MTQPLSSPTRTMGHLGLKTSLVSLAFLTTCMEHDCDGAYAGEARSRMHVPLGGDAASARVRAACVPSVRRRREALGAPPTFCEQTGSSLFSLRSNTCTLPSSVMAANTVAE